MTGGLKILDGSVEPTNCNVSKANCWTTGWTDPWRATWQAGQTGSWGGAVRELDHMVPAVTALLKKLEASTWRCNSSTRKMCNCTTTANEAARRRTCPCRRNIEAFLDVL